MQAIPVTVALVLCAATATWAGEYWVATDGSDANPGTKAKPLATVVAARDKVRRLAATGLKEDVTVWLCGGVYELAEPLVFGPADSGTGKLFITYAAVSGETPVLSGGRRIRNWKKDEQGRWTAELPETKGGAWCFRQLTVNDRRATRARWPDAEGLLRIAGVSGGLTQFTFNHNIPGGNLAGQGAELVVLENWSVTRGLVASNDVTRLATVTPMGYIGHEWTTASPGKAAFIEGGRAFLDQPGEWFLDRTAGRLHYIPLAGEEPATAIVCTWFTAMASRRKEP